MITETIIDTRYPECDKMGIVHHAVYPIWYEVARMDFFQAMGFSYTDMSSIHVNPAMVDLHVQYVCPAVYPDRLVIRTKIKSFAGKKLELSYETFRQSTGEKIGTATTFHIWVGPDMRSYNLEQNLPEVFAKIRRAAEPGEEVQSCVRRP